MAIETQVVISKMVSTNPATGEVLREFECAGAAEVQAAVARARSAQPSWQGIGVCKRLEMIAKFQQLLNEPKQQVARVITSEAGKPVAEALLTEILVALDAARFLLQETYGFLREQPLAHGSLATKAKSGRLIREPYGVIGIISPWNYPFSIPATETLAALVAGNAVVLKPSEFTSMIALELAALLWRAGVPKDVLQVVVGDGETGAALLKSEIEQLAFTGSGATRL